MGFSHALTRHHFWLLADGGVIEVAADSGDDAGSIAQVRAHLHHIAKAFAAGQYDMPMFIHGEIPPGVAEMKAGRDKLRFTFEPEDRGGRVRILALDPALVPAIHAFLKYQIADHRTGDPAAVSD
jgi:hypothetical protein